MLAARRLLLLDNLAGPDRHSLFWIKSAIFPAAGRQRLQASVFDRNQAGASLIQIKAPRVFPAIVMPV
tara:strand:+ start:4780 stop:4983 length:204 start_codon:yes stop_codon:yes gene_type:complete